MVLKDLTKVLIEIAIQQANDQPMLTARTVFAGKDASRALAQSSLKEEECRPDWYDLADEHKKVLNDWHTFFSKRYNIKGKVEGATNT